MMIKIQKSKFKKLLLLTLFLKLVFVFFSYAQAACPENTLVGKTEATLVGEVIDYGGDSNLTVWFRYGTGSFLNMTTDPKPQYNKGLFCETIYDLNPCTRYIFRAVSQNSVGISYGRTEHFTTKCFWVNLRVNNLNGPITVSRNSNVKLTWTSENASSCQASGDWSGSKPVSGSEIIQVSEFRSYLFTINCQDDLGTEVMTDSATVNVRLERPTVITKPIIITY